MRTLRHSQRSGLKLEIPQGLGLSPLKLFQYLSFLLKMKRYIKRPLISVGMTWGFKYKHLFFDQFRLFCSQLLTLWRSHLSCTQTPTCAWTFDEQQPLCNNSVLAFFLLFDCFSVFRRWLAVCIYSTPVTLPSFPPSPPPSPPPPLPAWLSTAPEPCALPNGRRRCM